MCVYVYACAILLMLTRQIAKCDRAWYFLRLISTIWNHYKCSTLNNNQPWEISWEQVNFATIISIIINTNRTQKSSHIVCIICIVKHSNVQNLFSTILHCGILSPRECHFLYAFKYHTLLWLNAYFIAQRGTKKHTKIFSLAIHLLHFSI